MPQRMEITSHILRQDLVATNPHAGGKAHDQRLPVRQIVDREANLELLAGIHRPEQVEIAVGQRACLRGRRVHHRGGMPHPQFTQIEAAIGPRVDASRLIPAQVQIGRRYLKQIAIRRSAD